MQLPSFTDITAPNNITKQCDIKKYGFHSLFDKSVRNIKKFGHHSLIETALQLQERGLFFEMEITDNTYNFFKRKLVRSRLSKEQYERWYVQTKDMIELLQEMIRKPEPLELSSDAIPTTTSFSQPDTTSVWSLMTTSYNYYNDLKSELDIKVMDTTAQDLSEMLQRIKLRLHHLSEGVMFIRGRWVDIVE